MHDTKRIGPDHRCLFGVAATQKGHFTNSQAAACGFGRDDVAAHARTGRFIRERRGLYRLRDYPSDMHEEIMVAWLAVGRTIAVVSHQSALALHELSDVIPDAIHLTVPRSRRTHPNLLGTRIHTSSRPFGPLDVVTREGMRVTSPIRTVLDVDDLGLSLEHVEVAARQVIDRGQGAREMFTRRARGGRFLGDLESGRIHL